MADILTKQIKKNNELLKQQSGQNQFDLKETSKQFLDQYTQQNLRLPGAEWTSRAPSQFNVGLAQMLGLPGVVSNVLRNYYGYDEPSAFPTGEEIQETMAKMGMTYEPGEQPETITDRFFQNLGASSPFITGMAMKGVNAARPYIAEILASYGGAAGGKVTEESFLGKKYPYLSRAIGEIAFGLPSGAMASVGGIKQLPGRIMGVTPVGWAKKPFRGRWARKRAIRRLGNVGAEPSVAREQFTETQEFEDILSPTQRTGDRGIAGLRKQIEADIPEEGHIGVQQRAEATERLREIAVPESNTVADARAFLDKKLKQLADEADQLRQKASRTDNPVAYNKQARQKLEKAYDISRQKESQIWQNLPERIKVAPNNVKNAYIDELENITEGGDIGEINEFIQRKLGKLNKKGKLVGGELIHGKKKTASAKAIHQFYSRLGREIRKLAQQPGNTNEIRILNRIRKSALDDLNATEAGEAYNSAIEFSKDLNDKFTTGDIGKLLGFERGLASPETTSIDELLQLGGQRSREALEQLFKSTPEAKENVKDLIRRYFTMAAEEGGRINSNSGKTFLKKHDRMLDLFPDLKNDIQQATKKQLDVDEFAGKTKPSDISPLIKQETAASVFLGSNPGDEIEEIIKAGKQQGSTTKFFKELVTETSKDTTGKAKKGLKNAFIEHLLKHSEQDITEGTSKAITGETFTSGRKFLKRLGDLEDSLKQSGMLTEGEVNRLKKIGKAFKGLETEITAPATGKIFTDVPGRALDWLAAVAGARAGAWAGGKTMAGGIQTAGKTSTLATDIVQSITKDEARDLLIQSTRDPKLFQDLMKNARRMNEKQQADLATRILEEARDISRMSRSGGIPTPPAGAVAPAMVTYGEKQQENQINKEIQQKMELLKGQ